MKLILDELRNINKNRILKKIYIWRKLTKTTQIPFNGKKFEQVTYIYWIIVFSKYFLLGICSTEVFKANLSQARRTFLHYHYSCSCCIIYSWFEFEFSRIQPPNSPNLVQHLTKFFKASPINFINCNIDDI